ncbi:MAG: N-acetylmuramoyl-L-alanine amidase [Bacteroidaceae bacterium]|nr:N-acetylmuramoyl-L-alanine amidase [Bacteroidaceae bacterium]
MGWLCCVMVAVAGNPVTIVIDAGHGGKDPGAIGKRGKEKDINLSVALAVGRLVEQQLQDVNVVYTRKTDVFVELNERANIANRAKADLFISIHTNAVAGKGLVHGAETYTLGMHRAADNLAVARRENEVILLENDYEQRYEGFDPRSAESYIIFELMQDVNMSQSVRLATLVQKQMKTVGRVDKGVHQAGFLVLRATSMPSCLIELGYITNATEETYLLSQAGVNQLAQGIFQAIKDYFKL